LDTGIDDVRKGTTVTTDWSIWEQGRTVRFKVLLQPRASVDQIVGLQGDSLKIRLTSPPIENRANRHLQEFLSGVLGCPKRSVEIASGSKSKHKVVAASGFSASEILNRLAQYLVD